MDYQDFNLESFEFFDESSWVSRRIHSLLTAIASLFDVRPGISPVTFKGREKWSKVASLKILAEAIGFDDPVMLRYFDFHQKRRYEWILLAVPVYLVLIALLSPFLVQSWDFLSVMIYQLNLPWKIAVSVVLLVTIIPLFTFVLLGIAFRFTSALTKGRFAETLCVITAVYLVIQLSRDDALARPDRRKALLARMDDLARNTLLLEARYSAGSNVTQNWVESHFKKMESYIRERERWVIAPADTTLGSLRRDFYRLATIYATANYGNFIWPEEERKPEETKSMQVRLLLGELLDFLGILLPLAIIGFLLWQPTLLEALNIEANALALVFLAWLLLSIDRKLKLGVVDGLVGLAKGIKELK
jgi:hypothetical protein